MISFIMSSLLVSVWLSLIVILIFIKIIRSGPINGTLQVRYKTLKAGRFVRTYCIVNILTIIISWIVLYPLLLLLSAVSIFFANLILGVFSIGLSIGWLFILIKIDARKQENTVKVVAVTQPETPEAIEEPSQTVPPEQITFAKSSAMDPGFMPILQKITSERGFAIFEDYTKCKSLLADYTAGEYRKESRLLLLAIEVGCAGEIIRSNDPEISRNKLINKLHDEFGMETGIAEQIVALLYEVYQK